MYCFLRKSIDKSKVGSTRRASHGMLLSGKPVPIMSAGRECGSLKFKMASKISTPMYTWPVKSFHLNVRLVNMMEQEVVIAVGFGEASRHVVKRVI